MKNNAPTVTCGWMKLLLTYKDSTFQMWKTQLYVYHSKQVVKHWDFTILRMSALQIVTRFNNKSGPARLSHILFLIKTDQIFKGCTGLCLTWPCATHALILSGAQSGQCSVSCALLLTVLRCHDWKWAGTLSVWTRTWYTAALQLWSLHPVLSSSIAFTVKRPPQYYFFSSNLIKLWDASWLVMYVESIHLRVKVIYCATSWINQDYFCLPFLRMITHTKVNLWLLLN